GSPEERIERDVSACTPRVKCFWIHATTSCCNGPYPIELASTKRGHEAMDQIDWMRLSTGPPFRNAPLRRRSSEDTDHVIAVSAQGEQPEIIVIGGGQAGLALGYWLQRRKRRFVILDREPGPGGAWRHAWESLTLFSPGHWSSLPGWLHPGGIDTYPSRDAILDYLE